MSFATLHNLQNGAFAPGPIAKAIANKEYEPAELMRYVNGDVETRRRIFNDMVDSPSSYGYLGSEIARVDDDLTYDEKKLAVGAFLNSYMYIHLTMKALEEYCDDSGIEWNESAANAIFLDNDTAVNEEGETIVDYLIRDAQTNPTAVNMLYLRNAIRGEQNGLEILEAKKAQITPAAKASAEAFPKLIEGMGLVQEQTALFSNAVQVDREALDPDLDMDDLEPSFVEQLDGLTADNLGFSAKEEMEFGWRAKPSANSGSSYGNLIVDDLIDQKVTTDMMLKTVGNVKKEGTLQEVYKKMTERRDQIMAYVFGGGDASGAFRCVLDKRRLQNNELVFDKKKLQSYMLALSNRNIAKMARAAVGQRESENYFASIYNNIGENNRDPENRHQREELTGALRSMKEEHANRSFFFKVFHLYTYIKESRNITAAENILRETYHVEPEVTDPTFDVNAVDDVTVIGVRIDDDELQIENNAPLLSDDQPAVEQMEIHEAAIDTVIIANNEQPAPEQKAPEVQEGEPQVSEF